MKKADAKRLILIEKLADYILVNGLQKASLRSLAAAVGTSDRMLLHYFDDKEELLTAILILITKRLVELLDNARSEQMSFQTIVPYIAEMIKNPEISPYTRLWLELVTFASGGEEYYRSVARKITDIFCNWIASVLVVESEEERIPMASLIFATIEGFVLLDTLEYGDRITNALNGIKMQQAHLITKITSK